MAKFRKRFQFFNLLLGIIAVTLLIIGLFLLIRPANIYATQQIESNQNVNIPATHQVMGWAFLSAAISVGLSCVGAGIAVSIVGSAAMGAVSERPELMGRSLVYVGLAEGIAIYGLIIGILILGKV